MNTNIKFIQDIYFNWIVLRCLFMEFIIVIYEDINQFMLIIHISLMYLKLSGSFNARIRLVLYFRCHPALEILEL
jgi:hypothetical protein